MDIFGGAARATYRLHQGLLALGEDSTLFVGRRESDDPSVVGLRYSLALFDRVQRGARRLLLRRAASKLGMGHGPGASHFSDDRTEYGSRVVAQLPPWDVLHLHWISGFVDYLKFFRSVPRDRPIVWTLHDMNAFTGGCHFDGGCARYVQSCGCCPQLNSQEMSDFSHDCWNRKSRGYRVLGPSNLHLVTPSQWLAQEARRSSLLGRHPITVIPYGLDTEIFQPRDSRAAREVLGLPQDAKIILFLADRATEARKGFRQLVEALSGIEEQSGLFLLYLGRGHVELPPNLPGTQLAYESNDRLLSMIYSSADVFVLPALQDNLPNTVLEAQACGLPVVAFSTGGIPDLVRDGVDGRLVTCGDTRALGDAILRTVKNDDARRIMGTNARNKVEQEYSSETQARRYLDLYRSMGAA